MHVYRTYVLITFHTTTQAIHFESCCDIEGRLIPLPSSVSAGCGLAWRSDVKDKLALLDFIKENKIAYAQMIEIMMR